MVKICLLLWLLIFLTADISRLKSNEIYLFSVSSPPNTCAVSRFAAVTVLILVSILILNVALIRI